VAIDRIVLPIIIFRFLGRELRAYSFAQSSSRSSLIVPINMWTCIIKRVLLTRKQLCRKRLPRFWPNSTSRHNLISSWMIFPVLCSARFLNSARSHCHRRIHYRQVPKVQWFFKPISSRMRPRSCTKLSNSEPEQIWRNGSVSVQCRKWPFSDCWPPKSILGGSRGVRMTGSRVPLPKDMPWKIRIAWCRRYTTNCYTAPVS